MTQKAAILAHLKRAPLTPLEAWRKYGAYRLGARIMELRRAGHKIETDIIERRGHRFACYRMRP